MEYLYCVYEDDPSSQTWGVVVASNEKQARDKVKNADHIKRGWDDYLSNIALFPKEQGEWYIA